MFRTVHTFSAAALVAGLMLAAPVMAADPTPAAAPAASKQAPVAAPAASAQKPAAAPVASAKTPAAKPHHHHQAVDPVEARIKKMQKKLHVTAAQTEQWNAVAQAMRNNAKSMHDVVMEKRKSNKTMTAVEDLKAYQHIAETHAEGIKKLTAAFEPFYASLSDKQKKAADDAFRAHKARHHH